MIELPNMVAEEAPLINNDRAQSSGKSAWIGLLAIVGLATVALARGNVNFLLKKQAKITQVNMCNNIANLGYTTKAQADCITDLPGLTFQPNFRSFSGYLNVGRRKQLFYWFVENQHSPKTAPLVFWTNGGPGCSGLDGLLSEHGPYLVFSDLTLRPNKYALNKLANVVYIEAPLGVGFSKPPKRGNIVVGDKRTARDSARMIRKFLRRYPQYAHTDVYLASESYGGHYMPTLAEALLDGIDKRLRPIVNFKGFVVGNPFVNFYGNMRGSIHAYAGHGLVPLPLQFKWNINCDTPKPNMNVCGPLYNGITKLVGHLDPYALDFTFCPVDPLESGSSNLNVRKQNRRMKNYMMKKAINKILKVEKKLKYVACADNYMTSYLNQPKVQKAIHAKKVNWQLCSNPVHAKWPQKSWQFPMELTYQKLAASGRIKMMVYSGDDDSVCSTYGTQLWMWTMGFRPDPKINWRAWYLKDQLGGFQVRFMSADNSRTAMDFTTVHSAGHMVPQTQPQRAFVMYKAFLASDPNKGFTLGDKYV